MSKKIVWIEDDSDIIKPVIRPLQLAGHSIEHLYSAAEALAAVEMIREADLILIDMILPAGKTEQTFSRYAGKDVLKELREVHDVETPAVVFSVVTKEEVLEEIEAIDVVDIVRKPVLPSELKTRVERALGIIS